VIPDAEIILGALAPRELSERAVRAAVQHARSLAREPIDEPAAMFFAFAARPRAVPSAGLQLAIFLARDQAEQLGIRLDASDEQLRDLRMRVLTRAAGWDDVRDWFAQHIPVD
jgi:hypothetical protein